jgi:type IV secretory pathway VirB9-like protein
MKQMGMVLMLAATAFVAHAASAEQALKENTNYKVSLPSPPEFYPTKVWDDGKFTFVELKKQYAGELPAVFLQDEDGQLSLVNFFWDPKTSSLVIKGLIQRVVLISGNKRISISRNDQS